MERQFFSGNSVEQALLAASRHHGLDPTRVAYKLRDKKHGYLNVRRRVVIEVDPNAPEKQNPLELSPTSDHAGSSVDENEFLDSRKESSDVEEYWLGEEVRWQESEVSDPATASIEYALDELAKLMGTSFEVESQRYEEVLEIELTGDGSDAVLADGGRALYAIEYLLPRLMRSMVGDGSLCKLDCDGFRQARELELTALAHRAAERAVHSSTEEVLEPMNPADRRLVHLALAEDAMVRTESEGHGFIKRVRIVPTAD